MSAVGGVARPVPARSPASTRAAQRTRARATGRPASSASRGMLGGVAWIVALAVLLAGVVAVNVVVLQLNLRLDKLGRERVSLKDTNAALEAQLASSGSPFAVERLAQKKLRLVQAPPDRTTYVQLAR